MKISFILTSLSLWCSITGLSQKALIDSLESALNKQTLIDTVRVNVLNEMAFFYHSVDSSKAFLYLDESESISKQINFKKGEANAIYLRGQTRASFSRNKLGLTDLLEALKIYEKINDKQKFAECSIIIGKFHQENSHFNQAIKYYKDAEKSFEEIGDLKGLAVCLYNIGTAVSRVGKFNESIHYFNESIAICRKIDYPRRLYPALNGLAGTYGYQGKYTIAIELLRESKLLSEKFNDSASTIHAITNLGIVYFGLAKYDEAIASYKEALDYQKSKGVNDEIALLSNNLGLAYKEKKDFDSAYFFLNEALLLFEKTGGGAYASRCLNNIGEIYEAIDDNRTALIYFKRGKQGSMAVGDRLSLCNSYFGIARYFNGQKKYRKAIENAIQSLEISNDLDVITYQKEINKLLSEIHESIGNHKESLKYFKSFKAFNDSVFSKEAVGQITAMEYEYKYKRELDSASIRELILTKEAVSASKNLAESRKNLLWSVVFFLLVLFVLGAIIFFLKFRNVKTKTENLEIEQKLLRSQMTPHFVFNSLSVLQGMILNKEEKKSVSYLSKFSKLLRIILENSRDKTVSLSEEIEAVDSYLTLQSLADSSYQYTISVSETIDESLIEIPAMLIQPFAENAVEHAFTNAHVNKKIEVRLAFTEAQLICTIVDNGVGINSKKEIKTEDKKSLATTITTERLKLLSRDFKRKGSIKIEDRKKYQEQGTKVTLIIPYKLHVNNESADHRG